MSRVAVSLECSKSTRILLEKISRSHKESKRLIERSKIILYCLSGLKNKEVANILSIRENTVNCLNESKECILKYPNFLFNSKRE